MLKKIATQSIAGLIWFVSALNLVQAQTAYQPVPQESIDSNTYGFLELNGGEFGNGFGSDNHANGYGVNIFLNDVANSPTNIATGTCNAIYKLSYKVFDIDVDGEIRIYINNLYTAFITATGEAQTRARKIEFCGSLLQSGNNLIEFRVADNTSIWGVQDILLKYMVIDSIDLPMRSTIHTGYGNGFGSNKHPDYLVANFNSANNRDLSLSIKGWDIDRANELSVYVNDNFFGFLSAGCNRCLTDANRYSISSDSLAPGRNQLALIQRNENELWGVTELFLSTGSNIAPIINLILN